GCESSESSTMGEISMGLRSPEDFTAPFCVMINVSGMGFSPIHSEQIYPAGSIVELASLPRELLCSPGRMGVPNHVVIHEFERGARILDEPHSLPARRPHICGLRDLS